MNTRSSKRTTVQNIFSRTIKVDNHELQRPDVFYVGLNKKGRIYISRLIEKHGGRISSVPVGHNVISLVDERSKPSEAAPSVFSIQYVVDCVNSGERLDIEPYRIKAPRGPGPKRRSKTKNNKSPNAKLTTPGQQNHDENTHVRVETPNQKVILVGSNDDHVLEGKQALSNKIANERIRSKQKNNKQTPKSNEENGRPWSEEENEELRECIRNVITILERKNIDLENIFNERLWVTLEEGNFFPEGRNASECCRQAIKHKDLVPTGKKGNYKNDQVMSKVALSMKENDVEAIGEEEEKMVEGITNVDKDSNADIVTPQGENSRKISMGRAKSSTPNSSKKKHRQHSKLSQEHTDIHESDNPPEEYRNNNTRAAKETSVSRARREVTGEESGRLAQSLSGQVRIHRKQSLNQDDSLDEVSSSQETQEPRHSLQQEENVTPHGRVLRRQRSSLKNPKPTEANPMHIEDTPVALDLEPNIIDKIFPHREKKHLNKSSQKKINIPENNRRNLKPSKRVSSDVRPFKRKPENKSQLRIFLLVRDIAFEARVSEKQAFQALRQEKGDPNRALRVLQRRKR